MINYNLSPDSWTFIHTPLLYYIN